MKRFLAAAALLVTAALLALGVPAATMADTTNVWSPSPITLSNNMISMWAASPSEVFAVGSGGPSCTMTAAAGKPCIPAQPGRSTACGAHPQATCMPPGAEAHCFITTAARGAMSAAMRLPATSTAYGKHPGATFSRWVGRHYPETLGRFVDGTRQRRHHSPAGGVGHFIL